MAVPRISHRRRNLWFYSLLGVAILILSPTGTHADAGIPMLPFTYPIMILFLVPVIGIEASYIRLRLHTGWWNTLSATSRANLVTMVLGYPLAWVIWFGLELLVSIAMYFTGISDHFQWKPGITIANVLMIAASAAWLGPGTEEHWPFLVAFVVLLLPSFFVSGFVESFLMGRPDWLGYEGKCGQIIWQANLLSYTFLAIVGCVCLRQALNRFAR